MYAELIIWKEFNTLTHCSENKNISVSHKSLATPFSSDLLGLHICTLWSYNSCQVLQSVDYWQGKGQSSSLECADTYKLFNFLSQRSVVRKYWAGQRWGETSKKKKKSELGNCCKLHFGLCVCKNCCFLSYSTKSNKQRNQ